MVLRDEIGYETRKKGVGMEQEAWRKGTREHGGGCGGLRPTQVEGEEAMSSALDSFNFRHPRLPHRFIQLRQPEFRGA